MFDSKHSMVLDGTAFDFAVCEMSWPHHGSALLGVDDETARARHVICMRFRSEFSRLGNKFSSNDNDGRTTENSISFKFTAFLI